MSRKGVKVSASSDTDAHGFLGRQDRQKGAKRLTQSRKEGKGRKEAEVSEVLFGVFHPICANL